MGTTSKALSLLELFSQSTPAIGLSELARRSGFNKATVHRLMADLAAHGFVEQIGTAREYRLGPAVLRLAQLREAAVPMRDVVRPILTELAAETGETAHVSLVQGTELVTFDFVYSLAHGTLVSMSDAPVLPFHATSSGLAILAFSEPAFVDRALGGGDEGVAGGADGGAEWGAEGGALGAFTAKTCTDPAAIRAALEPVRRDGVAESEGGFEADVHSHAMPLFDVHQRCIGAVAVATPTSRMAPQLRGVIRAALRRQAVRLTAALGGLMPEGFPNPDGEGAAAHSPGPADTATDTTTDPGNAPQPSAGNRQPARQEKQGRSHTGSPP